MATGTISLDVEVVRYRVVFFPVATFRRVGDSAILTIFGLTAYKRLGDKRKILWMTI